MAEPVHRLILERKSSVAAQVAIDLYWLRPNELFARAFAQYIAAKIQSQALKAEIRLIRAGALSESPSAVPANAHWSDPDFREVKRSLDRAFSTLGWLKDPPAPIPHLGVHE